jgi:hypothetical protein
VVSWSMHPQRPDGTTPCPNRFLSRVFPCEFLLVLLIFHGARRCLYLIPSGSARRSSQTCRTARRRQGRAWVWRGLANPCPPSTVLLSNQHRRAAEMGIRYRFPVVSLRAVLHPPHHHDAAADHPISYAENCGKEHSGAYRCIMAVRYLVRNETASAHSADHRSVYI